MITTQRELREGNPDYDEMRDDIAEHLAMNMSVSEIMTLFAHIIIFYHIKKKTYKKNIDYGLPLIFMNLILIHF